MGRTQKYKGGSMAFNIRIPATEPERSQAIKAIHKALEPFEVKNTTKTKQ